MNTLTEEQRMPVQRRSLEQIEQDGLKRMYWSIGQTADKLGVAASAIRFYDKTFTLGPKRNHEGNRIFTESQVDQLNLIIKLCKHYKLETVQSIVKAGLEFEAVVKLEEIMAKI